MRSTRALLVTTVLAVGLTGCGTGSETLDRPATQEPDVVLFGDCRADDPGLGGADVVAEADVDGSGAPEEIAYVRGATGGPCANALVTTLDGEPTAMSLGDVQLDQRSVQVIQLVGTDRQLVVAHEKSHPRGGYYLRLYGAADGQLGEVLVEGEPVVGFVATDGGAAPTTATCLDDGGLATISAVPHEPPGVVLAWDVTQVTYSLDGNSAGEAAPHRLEEAVADRTLRNDMAQLFDLEGHFADCITS